MVELRLPWNTTFITFHIIVEVFYRRLKAAKFIILIVTNKSHVKSKKWLIREKTV